MAGRGESRLAGRVVRLASNPGSGKTRGRAFLANDPGNSPGTAEINRPDRHFADESNRFRDRAQPGPTQRPLPAPAADGTNSSMTAAFRSSGGRSPWASTKSWKACWSKRSLSTSSVCARSACIFA